VKLRLLILTARAGFGGCIASQEGREKPQVLELVSLVGGPVGALSGGDQYLCGPPSWTGREETESELYCPVGFRAGGLRNFGDDLLVAVEPGPRNRKPMESVFN
jgi:hypothetical protein